MKCGGVLVVKLELSVFTGFSGLQTEGISVIHKLLLIEHRAGLLNVKDCFTPIYKSFTVAPEV